MYGKRLSEKTMEFIKSNPYYVRNHVKMFKKKSGYYTEVMSQSLFDLLGYKTDSNIRGDELKKSAKDINWANSFIKLVNPKGKKLNLNGVEDPYYTTKLSLIKQDYSDVTVEF